MCLINIKFCFLGLQSNTLAQMVKAVRMILERESYASRSRLLDRDSSDIEIEDDAPKRKPTLEEIDALEVLNLSPVLFTRNSSEILQLFLKSCW